MPREPLQTRWLPIEELPEWAHVYLRDLITGVAQTEENRALVRDALGNRTLALCSLCSARSSHVYPFAAEPPPVAPRLRVVFYAFCSKCGNKHHNHARVWARIEAGEPVGSAVELASAGLTREELDQLVLEQFLPGTREFFGDRVIHKERYGLDWCSRCGTRPSRVFRYHRSGVEEPVRMYSKSLYVLCYECAAEDPTR